MIPHLNINSQAAILLVLLFIIIYIFGMCIIGILIVETYRNLKRDYKKNIEKFQFTKKEISDLKKDFYNLTDLIIKNNSNEGNNENSSSQDEEETKHDELEQKGKT